MKEQTMRITTLCYGKMFGEEDVINERFYTTTVICSSSTGVLYCIKADEFLAKFKSSSRTWKALVDRIIEKDKEIKEKIKYAG